MMRAKKEAPLVVAATDGAETSACGMAGSVRGEVTSAVNRHSGLKAWNVAISAAMARHSRAGELQGYREKLDSCGRWLLLRHYLATGRVAVQKGNYCMQHLLCPACAAARARRLVGKYAPMLAGGRCYHLSLTWPPPADLAQGVAGEDGRRLFDAGLTGSLLANLRVGVEAWGKLWARRKVRGTGPLRYVEGALLSTETTWGASGWHPHFHAVLVLAPGQRVEVGEFRPAWQKLTRGWNLRLVPLRDFGGIVEALKYACKFGPDITTEAGITRRIALAQALRGRRLVRSYGCLFDADGGNCEPDLSAPETCADAGAWIEYLLAWCGQEYLIKRSWTDEQESRWHEVAAGE